MHLIVSLYLSFFWKFSAFEYALKRSGFLTDKTVAEADRSQFGEQIKDKFENSKLRVSGRSHEDQVAFSAASDE
jgi:hypothetical protein